MNRIRGDMKASSKQHGRTISRKNKVEAKSALTNIELRSSEGSAIKNALGGASMEILRDAPITEFPEKLSPMLATLADNPFVSQDWIFEPKLDGIRCIAFVKNGTVRLSSRRGLDLTDKFPLITTQLATLKIDAVIDGEIVALDENGRPSFQHLQQSGTGFRSRNTKSQAITKTEIMFYVFDALHLDKFNLMPLPLSDRKIILHDLIKPLENRYIHQVSELGSDGPSAFAACMQNSLEGVVGKLANSIYQPGSRQRVWLKFKSTKSAEFLICGYTEGTGSRNSSFGSLLLGEYDDAGVLHFVGGVGTGFDSKALAYLLARMSPLITNLRPFPKNLVGKLNPTWLRPELVAEIKFMERTQDGMLRAPVFMQLRDDIEAKNVKPSAMVHVKLSPSKKLKLVPDKQH